MNETLEATSTKNIDRQWSPILAKPDSDGVYCYFVQRKISCYFSYLCTKNGISPNQATVMDLLIGVVAAFFIYFQMYILGIVFIQLFGIWSCVDGEIARLTNKQSKFGDFFDTMVDRVVEYGFIIAFYLALTKNQTIDGLALIFIMYLGAVFLITISSEKYRSAHFKNYPKIKVEYLFCWLSAGSDVRFLYFSFAIVGFYFTADIHFVLWIIGCLTGVLFLNCFFRIWKIYYLSQNESIVP
jgi:phosphatidylglycerophosphate synthase